MIKFLDINKNDMAIKQELTNSIINNIRNNEFINGRDTILFEKEFAAYIGTNYCIGVGNGTDALEIAIQSLELECGSEIIVQTNTFISTVLGITQNKLKPVFVDIDEKTMMMDVNKIEEKITDKTRAICTVHLFGNSPNMDKIIEIKKRHNLYLIEDCAQSNGSLYEKNRSGSMGDISCFSFYPGKNLGCYGDGGAICTNHELLYKRVKLLHNLGTEQKYIHVIKGRNSKLDTIQAGILRIKLKYLDECNQKRTRIANIYKSELSELNSIILPEIEKNITSVWHLFVIRVLNNKRDDLKKFLYENGIETIIHYPIPIHKQVAFVEYNNESYPNSEKTSAEIISLPIYPELQLSNVIYICDKIKTYLHM